MILSPSISAPFSSQAKAAVGIAVKGNAAVKAAFHDGLFQPVQVGAAHAPVDVLAVRRNADKGA